MASPTRARGALQLISLENRLMSCFEERSEMSEALSIKNDEMKRLRHFERMNELREEIRDVWAEYRKLAKPINCPV